MQTNRQIILPVISWRAKPVLIFAVDCQGYFESGSKTPGVYTIQPLGSEMEPFTVWCEFNMEKGWTVIQKRYDGSVPFNRNWEDYKNGFGSTGGEHWLG